MSLHLMNHLQLVLHVPEESVGLDQSLVFALGQQPMGLESFQCGERISMHDVGQMASGNHLNRLHKKFDLTDASDPKLHISPLMTAARYSGVDHLFDGPHAMNHRQRAR